jgi:hypothetical protein
MIFGGCMTTRILRFTVPLALTASLLLADFKYEQHSKMTGGSMLAMMKMAAKFSKTAQAAQDTTSTIAVKGNKMVTQTGTHATIYDLDQGVLTEVDFDKKTYSVVTFEEMKAFLEKNMKKANAQANVNLELDVKDTGRTETVLGQPAKEVMIIGKVNATDPQTGKSGQMNLEISSWMGPKMPGHSEMAAFYKKMGEKFAGAGFGPGGMMGNQPGMSAGMAEAAKKLAEMDGTNIVQIIRMIPTDPQQMKQMEEAQAALAQAGQNQAQMPSAKDAAGDAAGQAAASAVAGRLGRFGGLAGGLGGIRGRKQQEAPPPPPPAPAAQPEATASTAPVKGSFSSEVSMMELTVESRNFSSAPVDASMFSVPAGFKMVKSSMQ